MKKYLIGLLIGSILLLSSCKKQNRALFLSNEPINLNNYSVVNEIPTFYTGQRIYFALVSKKEIECPILRLQTIKLDNKYGYPIPHMEIPYAVDIPRGNNLHAVTDYFVLHQSGNYFLRIFEKDNLVKPIIEIEFIVEKK